MNNPPVKPYRRGRGRVIRDRAGCQLGTYWREIGAGWYADNGSRVHGPYRSRDTAIGHAFEWSPEAPFYRGGYAAWITG